MVSQRQVPRRQFLKTAYNRLSRTKRSEKPPPSDFPSAFWDALAALGFSWGLVICFAVFPPLPVLVYSASTFLEAPAATPPSTNNLNISQPTIIPETGHGSRAKKSIERGDVQGEDMVREQFPPSLNDQRRAALENELSHQLPEIDPLNNGFFDLFGDLWLYGGTAAAILVIGGLACYFFPTNTLQEGLTTTTENSNPLKALRGAITAINPISLSRFSRWGASLASLTSMNTTPFPAPPLWFSDWSHSTFRPLIFGFALIVPSFRLQSKTFQALTVNPFQYLFLMFFFNIGYLPYWLLRTSAIKPETLRVKNIYAWFIRIGLHGRLTRFLLRFFML